MLAVMIAVLAAPFGPQTGSAPSAEFDDAAFLKAVAVGGMYDGHLSYLVGAETRNEELRNFAAAVIAERIVASSRLKEVAKEAGVELPTKLDATHRQLYDAFMKYKGSDIERDYVNAMAERHALAIALFTRASKDAKNSTVRAFATATLPKIRERMHEAKKLTK